MTLKNMLILCTTALHLDGEEEVEPQAWTPGEGDPQGKYERREVC